MKTEIEIFIENLVKTEFDKQRAIIAELETQQSKLKSQIEANSKLAVEELRELADKLNYVTKFSGLPANGFDKKLSMREAAKLLPARLQNASLREVAEFCEKPSV